MDIEILSEPIISKIVEINGTKLEVFTDGRIYRFLKNGDLKIVENIHNTSNGYNYLRVNKRAIYRHRIIAMAFLNLNIDNVDKQVDHVDGQRLNNSLTNLRIVTHQQNQWNRTTAKGYYWNKQHTKWRAQIKVNKNQIYLGSFNTEQEAREAYLNAKNIHHIIQ